MKLIALFRKFLNNHRGVIATEFALVAPIMILLWVGMVELATAHLVAKKVEIAAQSAADIIAQDDFTDDAKLADIGKAINTILFPYPITNMGYRIASIVADSGGTNTVAWNQPGGTVTVAVPDPAIADNLTTTDDSVIVVTVTYNHTPVLVDRIIGRSIFGGSTSITLGETVFARPRLVPIIPRN